jgi:hypothetical protein
MQPFVCLRLVPATNGRMIKMTHKGIDYSVAPTATPGIWRWQFEIDGDVKTGKTETNLNLLAIRRVQLRIDRELRKPRPV